MITKRSMLTGALALVALTTVALPEEASAKHKRRKRKKKPFRLARKYKPQMVRFRGYNPGTIVVDTRRHFLYLTIGNGKAIALGEAEGFVKTVFDAKTGELLGAHMVGAEVTEMIQGFVVGKTLETTEAELMNTVFPHPTISESMHESVLASYGRALHI